jgi:predicted enzyme related to lactoylglutathione lyase
MRSLREKGVALNDVFDGPVCTQTSFADPDGNRITLHEKKRV